MPAPIVLLLAGAATIAGGAQLLRYVRARRAPAPKPGREARDGDPVLIEGTARSAGAGSVAPITGRACLKWHVEVEREVRANRSTAWVPHLTDESRGDFLVDDGTITARVLGAKAELRMKGPWSAGAPSSLRDFVAQRGESIDHELRWRERRVCEGDPVTVVGVARWETSASAAGAGYRGAGRQLVIEAPDVGWIEVR